MAAPAVAGVVCAAVGFAAAASLTTGDDEPRPPRGQTTAVTVDEGRSVFARVGCGNCHRLAAAGSSGQIGPDLDARLAEYTPEALRAKIVDPYPNGPEGFGGMPEDFGERMSEAELEALVSFLVAAGAGGR